MDVPRASIAAIASRVFAVADTDKSNSLTATEFFEYADTLRHNHNLNTMTISFLAELNLSSHCASGGARTTLRSHVHWLPWRRLRMKTLAG